MAQGHDHTGSYAGAHAHDGGALHWHDEFGEHLAEDIPLEERAAKRLDWKKHNAVVVTVGVDIGSSTTHLMFSRLFIQLVGEGVSARSVVVGRELLWKSPILLTPYLDDDTINVDVLAQFVNKAYIEVGATANEIDTGAIILTGEALKRKNARAIGELFADKIGKFVCAAAGHHMEAVLAANGSGTVARSARDQQTLLNVDIGGGTTKFALVDDGKIVATAAIAIGARQLVRNAQRRLIRIDEPVRRVAKHLGISLTLGEELSAEDEAKIVQTWTDILAGLIAQRPPEGLAAELMLTEPLPTDVTPKALTFSGGVSEFIFFREFRDYNDLGEPLAKAIRVALANKTIALPSIVDPNLGIRATAIGASQFTTQVGINAYVSDESVLPLRNLPVLMPRVKLSGAPDPGDAERITAAIRQALTRANLEEGAQPVAVSLALLETLDEPHMSSVAQGIREALPHTIEQKVSFVVLTPANSAQRLGAHLKDELGVPGEVIALEGISVSEFDFIDVAEIVHPTEIVPVSIKSLLFAGGMDRRSVERALQTAAESLP